MHVPRYIIPVLVCAAFAGCAGSYTPSNQVAEPPAFEGYTEADLATELEAGDWGTEFAPAVVDNVICTEQSPNKFKCDGDYIDGETEPTTWNVTVTGNGQWLADPVLDEEGN